MTRRPGHQELFLAQSSIQSEVEVSGNGNYWSLQWDIYICHNNNLDFSRKDEYHRHKERVLLGWVANLRQQWTFYLSDDVLKPGLFIFEIFAQVVQQNLAKISNRSTLRTQIFIRKKA